MFSDSSIGTAAPKRTVTTQQKCKIDDGEFGFHQNFGFRTRCSDPGDEDDEDDFGSVGDCWTEDPTGESLKTASSEKDGCCWLTVVG